ncbi:glycoside hydrolase family 15 protein [Babesia caballi]|uniref:Glycoside hydrolase family 15 protein n=1 Tax=Babesia caballi TaxID=5871 RepID=A0AAV4LUV0_BABCB|nr:glycoside hydrolase family 15 protein [Babesia caballi]
MATRSDGIATSSTPLPKGLVGSNRTIERCVWLSDLVATESSMMLCGVDATGVAATETREALDWLCSTLRFNSLQKLKQPERGGMSTQPETKGNEASTASSIKLRPT